MIAWIRETFDWAQTQDYGLEIDDCGDEWLWASAASPYGYTYGGY
jgi:hypothetical protein